MPQRHNLQGKLRRDRISKPTGDPYAGTPEEIIDTGTGPIKIPPKRSTGVKEEFVETGTGPIKMPPLKKQKEGPPLKAYKSAKLK